MQTENLRLEEIHEKLDNGINDGSRWAAIRKFYKNAKQFEGRVSARNINIALIKELEIGIPTKIEENALEDVLEYNANFYYQYPVGKYFTDLCDPERKIIIELDGKAFHRNNLEKDLARQEYLEKLGYTVFRFWGKYSFDTVGVLLEQLGKSICIDTHMNEIKAYAPAFSSFFIYYSVYGEDFKENIKRMRAQNMNLYKSEIS